MKIGIMQPYFLPYMGYFQLIREVDIFVLTDDYEFSKGGWINRNRIIQNNEVKYLTIPLKAASDYSKISERVISENYSGLKSLNALKNSYKAKEYFDENSIIMEKIFLNQDRNLFSFIKQSIKILSEVFNFNTKTVLTSDFSLNPNLSGQEKIIKICHDLDASCYVNLPGGKSLYEPEEFLQSGIDLRFLKPKLTPYSQGKVEFTPNLSIIDVLFNDGIKSVVNNHLPSYSLE